MTMSLSSMLSRIRCNPAFARLLMLAACFVPLLVLFGLQQPSELQLSVRVSPAKWKINQKGSLHFRFQVEKGRLVNGTRIFINMPGSWTWHSIHPVVKEGKKTIPIRVPTDEFAKYFSVGPERGSEDWRIAVLEQYRDGTYHRFDRQVVLTLNSGELQAGQTFYLDYGSPALPITASRLAETVVMQVDFDKSDGVRREVTDAPVVTTIADEARTVLVTASSQAVVGEPVRIHITARDQYGNAALLPAGLEVRAPNGQPRLVNLDGEARTFREVPIRFGKVGFQTVAVGTNITGYVRSNPILVTQREHELKLFWGDLHSHSSASKDGLGHGAFTFARNLSNLDFFASTEHSSGDRNDNGLTEAEWDEVKAAVRASYQPGRFVSLLAYECSLPAPYGHHNVYYASDDAPLYRRHEVKTLNELWKRLTNHRAFTVPHHTGVHWAAATWELQSPLRPLIEIFSVHGQSERLDPEDSLSYDQLIGTAPYGTFPKRGPRVPEEYRAEANQIAVISNSAKGPHYAQDAWAAGLELGTIASSDDHTARPGQPYWGLAAVWSRRLDREAIFESLLARQTYATTGQRIYLDFRVNGEMPGKRVFSGLAPQITLEVYGTSPVEWAEILKFSQEAKTYEVFRRWAPNSLHLKKAVVDLGKIRRSFYYVRLKQRELVEGRVAMAWSSPIWVEKKQP
jgi:hypothetical protein